jgi:hypothetical protein
VQEVANREVKRTLLRTTYSRSGHAAIDTVDGEVGSITLD